MVKTRPCPLVRAGITPKTGFGVWWGGLRERKVRSRGRRRRHRRNGRQGVGWLPASDAEPVPSRRSLGVPRAGPTGPGAARSPRAPGGPGTRSRPGIDAIPPGVRPARPRPRPGPARVSGSARPAPDSPAPAGGIRPEWSRAPPRSPDRLGLHPTKPSLEKSRCAPRGMLAIGHTRPRSSNRGDGRSNHPGRG